MNEQDKFCEYGGPDAHLHEIYIMSHPSGILEFRERVYTANQNVEEDKPIKEKSVEIPTRLGDELIEFIKKIKK
jgi:hypothetical protein